MCDVLHHILTYTLLLDRQVLTPTQVLEKLTTTRDRLTGKLKYKNVTVIKISNYNSILIVTFFQNELSLMTCKVNSRENFEIHSLS